MLTPPVHPHLCPCPPARPGAYSVWSTTSLSPPSPSPPSPSPPLPWGEGEGRGGEGEGNGREGNGREGEALCFIRHQSCFDTCRVCCHD